MKTPHKHAALIKAWADGAEIEKRWGDEWIEHKWVDIWHHDFEYRIKPTPKPDVIASGVVIWDKNHETHAAYHTKFHVSEHYERDNIKLTFCGETGELKSAEVLK